MTVTRFEPPARWHVASESDPAQTHLVDVLAFNGFGECSCPHFEYRLLPALKSSADARDLDRCKHLDAARDAFTDYMISYLNHPAHHASPPEEHQQ